MRTGCQSQVKAVLLGRMGGGGERRASGATQGLQEGAEKRQPGASRSSKCREPLYRQKIPKPSGRGLRRELQDPQGSRIQKSQGRGHQLLALLSYLWLFLWARRNIGRALPGECPCEARQHLPGPTASGVVSLKWVWMNGEVRGGNGCFFSRRSAPAEKGRCSVWVSRKPGWRPLDRCRRACGLKVTLSSRYLSRAGPTL